MVDMIVIEIIIGGLLAAAFFHAFRRMKDRRHRKFFAGSLIIAALIYVGFAAVGVSTETTGYEWLVTEIAGLLIYSFFAYAGVKISAWFLVAGWILHVPWDVGLHFGPEAAFVPQFYPPVCIGFDLVLGAFIAYRFFYRK